MNQQNKAPKTKIAVAVAVGANLMFNGQMGGAVAVAVAFGHE
jgi:hypothetical protein